ncbi:MAG: hypothetical protein ACYC55_10370, partial [Candidatus Geothermincolia bacterium]
LLLASALLLLLFARHFSAGPSALAFLWAAPALFGVALVARMPERLIERHGGVYGASLEQVEWIIFLVIVVFYVLAGVIYLAGLYGTLRASGGEGMEQAVAVLILAFLVSLIGYVVNEIAQEIGATAAPLGQVGMLTSGLLVLLAFTRFRMPRSGGGTS